MAKNLNMTQGNPTKLLFFFSLPLMLGNVFQQLYTVVDTAIVGRGVGMQALAALGTVDWLGWLFLGIAQGFTQGFGVRIAQKFGKQDLPGMRQVIGQAAFLSILLAIVGTAVGQAFLPVFLKLLRVPVQLQQMATLYIRILLAGFPAMVFYNFCSAVLRAVGNSKTPLYAMVVASLSNIVLDAVAVFLLHWGIAGAAAATVFSHFLSGLICAIAIMRTPVLRFTFQDMQPQAHGCKKLIFLGSPIAAKNIIIALGGMVVQTIVNGFTLSFIAGFTATNKLYGLLEIAATSYGYAVTTYVGQNFGAAAIDRIRRGIRSATGLAVATSLVIAGIMFVFGREITMIFISREDAALAAAAGEIAYRYLCVMSISLPMLYLLYVYQAGLQGMGNTLIPMSSGIVEFCLRVSLSMLIAFTGFQEGIFLAEVSAWWGAAIVLFFGYLIHFRKYWKNAK